MARRRKGRKGGSRKSIRIGAIIGLIGGAYSTWKYVDGTSGVDKVHRLTQCLIGYHPGTGIFDWKTMYFTIPAVAGVGLSLVASKVGLNRYTPKGINI